jgi:hypothetical protein
VIAGACSPTGKLLAEALQAREANRISRRRRVDVLIVEAVEAIERDHFTRLKYLVRSCAVQVKALAHGAVRRPYRSHLSHHHG